MITNFNKYMINEMLANIRVGVSFKLNADELQFCVLFFDATMKKRRKFIQELKKFFEIDHYIEQYIIDSSVLEVRIYQRVPNINVNRLRSRVISGFPSRTWKTSIQFYRCGYGGGSGTTITIDRFLEVGMKNIEEYLEIQKNVNKYNL